MRRRSRPLTSDERQLWSQVARGVTPLKGRMFEPEPLSETPDPSGPTGVPPPPQPRAAQPGGTRLPPLVPLERRTVAALRRGRQDVDAAIDLHGLRQAEAHQALRGFLYRAQGAGLKVVLVVTGKGAAGAEDGPLGERGVLRRMVPHWLRLPDLRPLVVGFQEAAAPHGGSGALYVRLRRPTRSGGTGA
jgi:DNA-nicking Smr family endonuclease